MRSRPRLPVASSSGVAEATRWAAVHTKVGRLAWTSRGMERPNTLQDRIARCQTSGLASSSTVQTRQSCQVIVFRQILGQRTLAPRESSSMPAIVYRIE